MGSQRFEGKRIAYIVAPMVLKNANGSGDPLIQLLPNVFRKDLKGMGDPLTVSISLNCLSRVCSEELASMLYKELLPLYTATKTLIRRKVCIVTYKMFLHYPDGIPELLPYLSDRLKDSKTGVQISAVTSIHEISRLNPRLFLVTIPSLFELFSHTKSNWLIIKLIKLVSRVVVGSELYSLWSFYRWSLGCMGR
jgi:AP-3 complex subunit delta